MNYVHTPRISDAMKYGRQDMDHIVKEVLRLEGIYRYGSVGHEAE